DPGPALPDPVLGLVAGKGVVEAECAADDEAAVGDVVRLAGGPLFDLVIDDERTNVKELFAGSGPRGVGGDAVGDALAHAYADGVGLGVGSGEKRGGRQHSQGQDLEPNCDAHIDTHVVWRVASATRARYSPRVGGVLFWASTKVRSDDVT